MLLSPKVAIIGSGFAGLSAACCLAKEGFAVTVLEKNATPGGRARLFEAEGFRFDMGPSWYWMPDVFEQFFNHFGKKTSDYYELVRLDPSYRIYFGKEEVMDLPAKKESLYSLFDSYEPGSSQNLKKFLADAAFKYKTGMEEFVFKPAHSPLEYVQWKIFKAGLKLQLLKSLSSEIKRLFKDSRLIRLLEFPVLFLGATPEKTPAMYSMMNYADMMLGTWYPKGGMIRIIDAMVNLAKELGVKFEFNSEISKIEVEGKNAKRLITSNGRVIEADVIVGGADYHHVEQQLLDGPYRQYTEAYWSKRVMAPSSLIFYLGIKGKLKNALHHNLFFDADFKQHSAEIYTDKKWPTDPLFYICVPSVTDPEVAPEGYENIFILIPIATDLEDTEEKRKLYFERILQRIEDITGEALKDRIVYNRSYCIRDFKSDYHSYKGNAYGLANTLRQTAFFKPKMKSKKVDNLYYTGQLTVPGPGIPPALISGQIVAREISKKYA
jgi:phytoene desaturase